MGLVDRIKSISEETYKSLVATRRHLHSNPELSFEEYATADFIEEKLKALGLETQRMANTGVITLIKGRNPDRKTIALRADIDALPIVEENEVPYKSINSGVMHACGHDVHTTSLLGACEILTQLKDEFEGTIKIIFQPGEERIPGGASLLIKEGVLEKPKVSQITGQHVFPLLDSGKVGFRSGMYMASADEIYLRIMGKGGHAAMPEQNVDPVIISAQVLLELQTVVSRFIPPKYPSVLSFGKIDGKGATNVIPNEVSIAGTFRIMNEEWRMKAHKRIEEICTSVAKAHGGNCEVEIRKGYPFLMNDEKLTQLNRQSAEEYLGTENVVDLDIWMGAEDFAYYTQEVPGCFYRLGTKQEGTAPTPVHTSTFDIEENSLKIGAGLLAYLAIRQLS